jgi:hypothetical protein
MSRAVNEENRTEDDRNDIKAVLVTIPPNRIYE